MNKIKRLWVLVLFTSLFALSCSTVPITGRKQLDLIPASQMLSMSFSQYDQFLKENKVSNDQAATALVQKVGRNIQAGVEKYFASKNMSNQLNGYKWEFNLVESKEANAWCMPGGKVVVYTGILPITKDENGLAVVLGHEIAHAVARHGDERMSQGLIAQLGGMALSEAVKNKPVEKPNAEKKIPDITGTWTGKFDSRLTTLKITSQDSTSFKGKITIHYREVINQEVKGTFNPEKLTLNMSDQLHSRYMGKYAAKLSSDIKNLTGTFTMNIDKKKLNFNLTKK